MIDEEILDKVCPIPDEDETMEEIKGKLGEEGFIINNFNKGGIFYIIIRIFVLIYIDIKRLARSIINNLFIKHAEGDWLEIKVADVGKKRKEAIKTRGYVTLYRDDYQNALQITKGHMFKTLPDVNGKELKFYVLDTTVIGAGEKSGKVLVEAESPGTGYNVSTGKITVSMIHLDGVVSVSNEEGWLYEEGADIEDLEDLRTRAEDAWSELAERTTEEKLINVSKKVSGVLDVRVDAQHPRGQGTTDIIITSTSGEATQELLKKVENATVYLKGNYDDFLYKSSTIVNVDIKLTLYIAKDASTDGVQQTAEKTIEKFMQLSSREELNCLYMDDIRYALKSDIETYKRAEISSPDGDIELDKGKVIMLGGIEVIVKNVGGA
jgi:phage-related baseplate assembly protein|nr:MAG TPA: Baseplate J like protein [Caudoviricetes sp.]